MEPGRNEHPEIDPDIRPEFGPVQRSSGSSDVARNLNDTERRAGKTQGGDSTGGDDSSALRNKEETPDTGLYRPGGGPTERGQTVSLKTILKKRGPIAAILTLGLGLPSILAIIFSPALVLQQFAETLTGKFNDQLGALDVRSTLLLKKKYNSTLTKGACGTTIKIRCKYRSIRESSGLAKRLNNAGITIEGDRSIIPGRVKPKTFTYQGRTIQAKDLLNEARKDPDLRKALRKGYDPLYAAFSDRNAADLRTRLGLRRTSEVKPSADEEKMNEDLKKTAAGDNNIPADGKPLTKNKDGEWVDSDGNVYTEAEARTINNQLKEGLALDNLAEKVKKSAVESSLKGALTTTAMGAGVVDSACTAYTMIRVAGFAAKYFQQRQLIRYGYEFMKIAHKQKSGDAAPEEITFFANKLTSTNSQGKNALNSDGYNFAAYGDIFKPGEFQLPASQNSSDINKTADAIAIQNETSRYVNGQLLNDNMMTKIIKLVTGSSTSDVSKADSVCKFTKSWKGQALVFGLAAAGVAVAALTGGLSLGAGAVVQGAASIAISVAFALIQPKLIDMAKGDVIKGDENGNETGNAVVSGIGGYNAQTAPASGLRPATQDAYAAYVKTSNEVAAKFAAEDRADRSPFDPTSPNTFVGSVLAAITPFTSKMQTAGSASIALPSMVASSLTSLGSGQKAFAANDADQYKQCNDPEYKAKNLAADPFCNLRYASGELDTDPEVVLDYMINSGNIAQTGDDPTPLPGSPYEDFVNKCLKRQSSIGDKFTSYKDGQSQSDGDPEGGYQCIAGTQSKAIEHRNNMFSAFWIDTRANDGMENDFDDASTTTTTAALDFTVASFNMCQEINHPDSCPSIPTKKEKEINVIRGQSSLGNPQLDIIGAQELSQPNQKAMLAALPSYKSYPAQVPASNGKAILWNTSKFTSDKHGLLTGVVGNGTSDTKVNNSFPWVHLKSTNGLSVYVMSVHSPNDTFGSPNDRYQNAVKILEWAKGVSGDGSMVVITGDFNNGDKVDGGHPGAYCYLTTGGSLQHAKDMAASKPVDSPCPSANVPIDHIYASTNINGLTAKGWSHIDDGGNVSGTDHSPAFVTYSLPGSTATQGGGVPGSYKNPVYNNSAPDPSIIKATDGTYHVYATGGSNDNPFIHLTSTDLVKWKTAGRTLTNAPAWVKSGLHWAPDVAKVGDKYILTFTTGTKSARKIAYAVGTSAAGPFAYKGVLVDSGEFGQPDALGTIDSHIFVDGSQPYLFFGGGYISVLKINVSGDGTITKDKASRKGIVGRDIFGTVEGSFVYKHGNYYYLYYSYGDYTSRAGITEYSTRIARATSVMGPYQPVNQYKPLITGKDPFRAPGHNSVVTDGQGNDWIIYHALPSGSSKRVLMLDPIKYSADGWPVVNDGHPSSGLTGVRI